MVSKPVVPPWNDGSKNLVRDLAGAMTRHRAVVLGTRGAAAPGAARMEPVYGSRRVGFSLDAPAQAAVAVRLALGRACDAWHFFFAPSPRTSRVARALVGLRRVRSVQTICSAPAPGAPLASLLYADRVVVLSRAMERRFLAEGVARDRLRRIAPAVAPIAAPDAEARRRARASLGLPEGAPLVLFPGDLEIGGGAERTIEALPSLRPDVLLVIATRAKTAGHGEAEARVRARAAALGVADRVRWIGETRAIHALVGAADVVALPSASMRAKIDLPLVLIEAMWMERAVVVAEDAPSAELADDGAAVAVAEGGLGAELARLIDDDDARAALGRRARDAALARYEPSLMARSYESLYDEVLDG